MRMQFLLAAAALGLLAGCGGGSGGGSGPAPSVSKSEARFDVDLKTGKVTITPAGGRAVYQGGAVSFTSSDVLTVSGDAGKRLIRVTAANHSGESWGGSPVNLTVSDVVNADAAALRANVRVSVYAGTGASGGADGYRTSAQMGVAYAICQGAGPLAGSLIATTGGSVRRLDPGGTVSTLAGLWAITGFADGTGSQARFNYPNALASDSAGNVFVADAPNRRVRRITPLGEVTTIAGTGVAGSGDGLGTVATFVSPMGVAVSPSGDRVYIADYGASVIRVAKFTGASRELPASYTVSTVAGTANTTGLVDGAGAAARFSYPVNLALLTDQAGVEALFVVDSSTNAVRRIASPAGAATVTTVAGDGVAGDTDGPGSAARFRTPLGLAAQWLDSATFVLYVSDTSRVRAIRLTPGASPTQKGSYGVVTLAGSASVGMADGDGNSARFNTPWGLVAVGAGSGATLYVVDQVNQRVRQVTVPGGALHSGGAATAAAEPVRLANGDNELPNRVAWTRTLTASSGSWTTDLQFNVPNGVSGFSFLATVETESNLLNLPAEGATFVSTLAGGDVPAFADGPGIQARFANPRAVVAVPANMRSLYRSPTGAPIRAFVVDSTNFRVRYVDTGGYVGTWAGTSPGSADGVGIGAQFGGPFAAALCPDGSLLVTDVHRLRRVWPNQQVTTVAGGLTPGQTDGTGDAATFYNPSGLAVTLGWAIYVADTFNQTIRRIALTGPDPRAASSYTVATLAGSPGAAGDVDGLGSAARFRTPFGLAADSDGRIYVADAGNNAIRTLTLAAGNALQVSTLATAQTFPLSLAVDQVHNVYVTQYDGARISRITPGGLVSTVAGNGLASLVDGAAGRLYAPMGLTIEDAGTLLFTDSNALRAVSRIIDTAAP